MSAPRSSGSGGSISGGWRSSRAGRSRSARSSGVPLIGLPGNPVAAALTFAILGRPLILRLAGARPSRRRCLPGARRFRLPQEAPGRREYVRASLTRDGDADRRQQIPEGRRRHPVLDRAVRRVRRSSTRRSSDLAPGRDGRFPALLRGDRIVKLLYFAWLRARIGSAEEELRAAAEVRDVGGAARLAAGARRRAMPRRCGTCRSSGSRSTRTMSGPTTRSATATRSRSSRRSPEAEAMIRVQREDFDIGAELERLAAGNHRIGGVASFIGLVRDMGGRRPGLGADPRALSRHDREEARRDRGRGATGAGRSTPCLIIHRYGRLEPGDRIVLVATASPHREAALAACHFLIDWLKTDAPFWKSEETPQASAGSSARRRRQGARRAA